MYVNDRTRINYGLGPNILKLRERVSPSFHKKPIRKNRTRMLLPSSEPKLDTKQELREKSVY